MWLLISAVGIDDDQAQTRRVFVRQTKLSRRELNAHPFRSPLITTTMLAVDAMTPSRFHALICRPVMLGAASERFHRAHIQINAILVLGVTPDLVSAGRLPMILVPAGQRCLSRCWSCSPMACVLAASRPSTVRPAAIPDRPSSDRHPTAPCYHPVNIRNARSTGPLHDQYRGPRPSGPATTSPQSRKNFEPRWAKIDTLKTGG